MHPTYHPLYDVIGPKHARLAITLTTNLVDKVKNTYYALKGHFPVHGFSLHSLAQFAQARKHRYGILDYFPFLGVDILLHLLITHLRRLIIHIWSMESVSRWISTAAFIFVAIPAAMIFGVACTAMLSFRLAATVIAGAITAAMTASLLLPLLQVATFFREKYLLRLASQIPFTGANITPSDLLQQLSEGSAILRADSTQLILSAIDHSSNQNAFVSASISLQEVEYPEQNDKAIGFNALFQLDYDGVAGERDPNYIPQQFINRGNKP